MHFLWWRFVANEGKADGLNDDRSTDSELSANGRRILIWAVLGSAYAICLALAFLSAHYGDLLTFARVNPRFLVGDTTAWFGSDGQFAYFIARDPLHAVPHLDVPTYRLQRILYPILAYMLALGRAEWVPLALVIVNVIAIGVGSAAFAALLEKESAPPWIPMLFCAWIGVAQVLLYDLNEITALAFSLWALFFFFRDKLLLAGVLFGLGALAKDMTFLFAIAALVSLAIKRRWHSSLLLGLLTFGPYVPWMSVLRVLIGQWSFDARATQFEMIPFAGLSGAGLALPSIMALLIAPGIWCMFLSLKCLDHPLALMTVLSLGFSVFLPLPSAAADAVFRLSSPLILASALLLAKLRHRRTLIFWSAIWSSTAVVGWLLVVWG
jgi:hypothetical protein